MSMSKLILCVLVPTVGLSACGNKAEKSEPMSTVYPALGFTLGRGYDPSHPLDAKGDCIENPETNSVVSWTDAQGINGAFSETRITSWEQMQKELSISAAVAAESAWGNGSGSFSKFEKFRSDSNSFTWLMKFVVETGQKTLKGSGVKLTAAAQALVDSRQFEKFYRMCGTHYIRSVKLGGSIIAATEINGKHTDIVQSITSKISSGGSYGTFGFSASAEYSSYFQNAKFNSAFSREVEQIGGSSINVNNLSPDKIASTLSAFQDEMKNQQQARVIGVEVASWETLGVAGLNDFVDWNRTSTLQSLYSLYRQSTSNLNQIDDLLFWQNDSRVSLSDAQLNYLQSMRAGLNSLIASIVRKGESCAERAECSLEGLAPVDIAFPNVKVLPPMVNERYAGMSFDIPEEFSHYGSEGHYDNVTAKIYDMALTALPDKKMSMLTFFIYKMECESPESVVQNFNNRLNSRGVPTNGIVEHNSGIGFYDLQWSEQYISRAIAMRQKSAGQCVVIKVVASGQGVRSWNQIPETNAIIMRLAESFRVE